MARVNVLAEMAKGLRANVYAVNNQSPVSRVAVYVRAGSRYEPNHVPGVSHYIRAAAGLTTQSSSVFGIERHMERAGATFKVTSDREYIIYRVDCMRDKLGHVLGFIDDTIHKPEFRSWELVDYVQPKLREELGRYKKNQDLVTNEAMHKAAFRGGLAHSLFLPEHQIETIQKAHLFEYLENNYVLDRMSFVGLGVDEEQLQLTIDDRFKLNGSAFKGVDGSSRYVGGEARIQAGFPNTKVNFVVQGIPITDLKNLAALEVISSLLGAHKLPIKYGSGAEKTLFNAMLSISPKIKPSIVNINYTDTGLYGFSLLGPSPVMMDATKTAVQHVRKVLSNISESDLNTAKKVTKARALIESENHELVFDIMGQRHASGITGKSPIDLVEQLSLKDVQMVAGNLIKSKPTLVSVGNPRYVPYVDELEA